MMNRRMHIYAVMPCKLFLPLMLFCIDACHCAAIRCITEITVKWEIRGSKERYFVFPSCLRLQGYLFLQGERCVRPCPRRPRPRSTRSPGGGARTGPPSRRRRLRLRRRSSSTATTQWPSAGPRRRRRSRASRRSSRFTAREAGETTMIATPRARPDSATAARRRLRIQEALSMAPPRHQLVDR